MCDQTEVSYLDNDVVWAKIGAIWWPGVVVDLEKTEDGKEILESMKSKPLCTVKFFDEENYEFVKTLENIYHYNCRRKDEFIKKGLDKHRTGAPHMIKFPADVARAERLVDGDINIIHDPKFQPEEKQSYSELFGSPKKKKKDKLNDSGLKSRKTPQLKTPYRQITHQRFLKRVIDGECDHEVRTRIQSGLSPEGSHESLYVCHICRFDSSRLNVIVSHYRLAHSATRSVNWMGDSSIKPVKRKSSSHSKPRKHKVKKLFTEEESADTPVKPTNESLSSPKKKFTEELLADWSDDEVQKSEDQKVEDVEDEEKEEEKEQEKEEVVQEIVQEPVNEKESDKEKLEENNKASCFDFEEEDDGFIGMSNASTYGRKIPRVIPVKDKTDLGVDLEVEELFKHKQSADTDEDELMEVKPSKKITKSKDKGEKSEKKDKQNKEKIEKELSKKSEQLGSPKPVKAESLASRRARRPGARKSYLKEIIEPIEEKTETKIIEISSKVEPVKKLEREPTSSRRKQDLKVLPDTSLDEEPYSEVLEHTRKTKDKKRKSKVLEDTKPDDLSMQIDELLAESVPDLPDEPKPLKSVEETAESLEGDTSTQLSDEQVDSKGGLSQLSLDYEPIVEDKNRLCESVELDSKKIVISKTEVSSSGNVTVLPIVKTSTVVPTEGCVVLPGGKKINIKKIIKKEPPVLKSVSNSESITNTILTAGKLKGQTILHQKDGKYVILTPPASRQKTSMKSATQSKVVIVTNQRGEQKIIKTTLPSKEDTQQPVIKMISDGKGGMKKIALSPKKVIVGSGGKYIVTGGGTTSGTSLGNGLHVIENYKGTGKTVIIQEPQRSVSQVTPTSKRPKILMKKSEEIPKILMKSISRDTKYIPVRSPVKAQTAPAPPPVQTQQQVIAMPGPVAADGSPTYVLVTVDEQGTLHPVENSSIVDLYVPPPQQTQQSDILAEALANTNVLDGTDTLPLLPPSVPSSVVQETSVTLQKPIMTPLEIPSSVAPDTSGLEPPPLPPTPTEEVFMDSENQDYTEYVSNVSEPQTYQYQESEQAVVYTEESQPTEGETYYQMEQVETYDDQAAGTEVQQVTYEQPVHEEQYIIEDSQESQQENDADRNYHSMPIIEECEPPDTSDDVPITDQDFVIHSSQVEQQSEPSAESEQQNMPLLMDDDIISQKRFQEETEVTSTTDEYEKGQ